MKTYERGLVQGKIEITIHHVNMKYLVHGIEWGVTPRTMMIVVLYGLYMFLVIF
jgi:hypothetical protein